MTAYITRRGPFRDVVTLREAMDRVFEDSFVPARGQSQQPAAFQLPIDAYVTAEEIIVVANLPGVKPEDVEITLEGDALTIKGERPGTMENVNYVIQERLGGKFQRTLNINVPVDAAKAEAHFENGMLTLTIPKAEAVKPKTIRVMSKESKKLEG